MSAKRSVRRGERIQACGLGRWITAAVGLGLMMGIVLGGCGKSKPEPEPGGTATKGVGDSTKGEPASGSSQRPAGDPKEIGHVLFIRGEATVEGPGREPGQKVVRGMALTNQDRVTVGKSGRLTLRPLASGGIKGFVLLKPGEQKALWDLGEEESAVAVAADMVKSMISSEEKWEESAAAFVRAFAPDKVPELIAPRGTVQNPRPTFHFRLDPQAKRHEVEIRGVMKFETTKAEYPFPAEAKDLPRGRLLFLFLKAYGEDDQEIGRFKTTFRILEEEDCQVVEAWLKQLETLRKADQGAAALVEAGYFCARELYFDGVIAALRASILAPQDASLEKGIDNILGGKLQFTRKGAEAFRERFAPK
ncbi:MAG: hypothetical protein ACYTHM_17780 [Planctomycetota bacterium]|jgi:hypothetical protein